MPDGCLMTKLCVLVSDLQAVYTVLREAEHRSTAPLAYWNLPGAKTLVPRQKRCQEALLVVNSTLDELISKCKNLVRWEGADPLEVLDTAMRLQCCAVCDAWYGMQLQARPVLLWYSFYRAFQHSHVVSIPHVVTK